MSIQYHTALVDLLQLNKLNLNQYEAILKEREAACGVRFPNAVRELFLMEGISQKFREFTEDDLVSNNITDEVAKLQALGDPEECQQGYLRIAVENQGVVAWYVRLTEGDNPPVYHNNDDWNENLNEVEWVKEADNVVNFMYDMIAQSCFDQWYTGLRLELKGVKPNVQLLEALKQKYKSGPLTDNKRGVVYRLPQKPFAPKPFIPQNMYP